MAQRIPTTVIVISRMPNGQVAAHAHFGQLKPTLLGTRKVNASQRTIDAFIRRYQMMAVQNFYDLDIKVPFSGCPR